MHKIDQYLQMGSFHTLHCEDAVVTGYITADVVLMAVMDGCSSGKESHFGATLGGRLLRKIAAELYQMDIMEENAAGLQELQRTVLRRFMEELRAAVRSLALRWDEVLFTVVMGLVNVTTGEAVAIVLGDGVVACNGELHRFDQYNRPDYPAYHLKDDFEGWYATQTQRLSFGGVRDLALSTDGVESLSPPREEDVVDIADEEVVRRVLCGDATIKAAVQSLRDEHGLVPRDDLGIVRLRIEN